MYSTIIKQYTVLFAVSFMFQCHGPKHKDIDRLTIAKTIEKYGNGVLLEKISYDKTGKEIELIKYAEGQIKSRKITFYNDNSNEVEVIYLNSDNSINRWYEQDYKGSLLVGGTNYNSSSVNSKFKIGYDENFRINQKIWYDGETDKITGAANYHYNELGYLIKIEHIGYEYESDSEPPSLEPEDIEEYQYDSLGRKMYSIRYPSMMKKKITYEYFYDTMGNTIEEATTVLDSVYKHLRYDYNNSRHIETIDFKRNDTIRFEYKIIETSN